jgi:serine/threonine-protein kinase
MRDLIGRTLGHYRIVEKIGEGGMGVVYRAHDERLDRDVAIKVLPQDVTADRDRLARFEREARVLASLNHPNIATLFGFEVEGDSSVLVMELVEGETLENRLGRGALRIEEALELARQIAAALEAAHESGVIHRDLKPSNVMVTPEGQVKVLDFGLAKALASEQPDSDPTQPPTISAATVAGTILGTAVYMSPEQARGKPVDRRTDIWALGCVLFEMLAGQRAFHGETVTDTLAAVLDREPDWTSLPSRTPPRVRELLERCLAKDRSQRLRHAGDAGLEIEAASTGQEWRPATEAGAKARRSRSLPWLVAAAMTVVAVLALLRPWEVPPSLTRSRVTHLAVPLPAGTSLDLDPIAGPAVAVSPDARRLAYVARTADGQRLFVHDLRSGEARLVPGSEGAPESPFFSPDGQWVGFFAVNKLKKVSVLGGSSVELCDAPSPRGGSWGEDGTIVFAPTWGSGLARVSAEGGTPEPLTTPDPAAGETSHRWPHMLPGGRAVLYTVRTTGNYNEALVAVLSLETGERKVLVEGGSCPAYTVSGYLLFTRAGTLLATPLDLERLDLAGSPIPVLERVAFGPLTGAAQYAISSSGSLLYRPGGSGVALSVPVWVDRTGRTTPIIGEPGYYWGFDLSPDGTQLAMDVLERGGQDVWIVDIASGARRRLTFDGRSEAPKWTPDAQRVVFTAGPSRDLFWKRADGSGEAELLVGSPHMLYASGWSPDGKELAFGEVNLATGWDTLVAEVGDEISLRPHDRTMVNVGEAVFSPDGCWLAYISDESGGEEIYVQPYPATGSQWQVSVGADQFPTWRPDGRELFYRAGNALVAVPVDLAQGFSAGPPRVLFETDDWAVGSRFCVSPDGQRFVRLQVVEQDWGRRLHFVMNWLEELERLKPPGSEP